MVLGGWVLGRGGGKEVGEETKDVWREKWKQGGG